MARHQQRTDTIRIEPDQESTGQMRLTATQLFPGSRETIFAFFADAANLEAITPPWLHFRILTPFPITMKNGALIDYRLRLRGIPIRWRTEICDWQPAHSFVDQQLRGPYRLWHHTHTFEDTANGTLMTDTVRYIVPGGRLINWIFVAPDLRRIFRYRQQVLARHFSTADSAVSIGRRLPS